jgi:iron complex transport system substrate-binding protein
VADYPSRIVCLTEETTETLYRLGEGDRVVGVSGYTVRPPEARRKPRVSAFINARFEKIDALEPDLVLAFSDLQADIVRELIRRGHTVFTFNQRSVGGILQMIRLVAALVGCADKGRALAAELERGLDDIAGRPWREALADANAATDAPRVYFEEWDDPLISGIRWVEELVAIAGGVPIFPELRDKGLGRDRIVDPAAVIERNPDVIVASWCGKPVRKPAIVERPGWARITAVRTGQVHEIKSSIILQPGPAALTDGVRHLRAILSTARAT